jgi:hypothetical protein
MTLAIETNFIYTKMALKALIKSPSIKTLSGLFKHFSSWRKHLSKERSSVVDKQPWLGFAAIDFIKNILKPEMSVFEYGSGGSTLFWAGRVGKVVSVEHNREWFSMIKQELDKLRIQNVVYSFIPPESIKDFERKNPGEPTDYISADEDYRNLDFKNYASFIDRYPRETFDLILVDGRSRPSCIAHALDRLKKNGYLIIDNSERSYYLQSFNFSPAEWKMYRFFGPVPYTYSFSETTIIKKK